MIIHISPIISHLACLMLGGAVGIFVMCMVQINKPDNREQYIDKER